MACPIGSTVGQARGGLFEPVDLALELQHGSTGPVTCPLVVKGVKVTSCSSGLRRLTHPGHVGQFGWPPGGGGGTDIHLGRCLKK